MTTNHVSDLGVARHGWVATRLRNLLTHPLVRGIDLDSPEATSVHERLIRQKGFLRRLYWHYYTQYEAAVKRAIPGGLVLEIGSGGGFYREIRREAVFLDVRRRANVDIVGSALALPVRSESVSAVLMLNVLHHLQEPVVFFHECERVLKRGGRVCLIEPYVSPLSRRLVKPLHHEPWNETGTWALPASGPMTGANMALPWIMFARDRRRYDREFPNLPVDRLQLHTIMLYLLSGGVSMRSFVPGALFRPMLAVERLLAPAGRWVASMMTVEFVRQ